MPGPGYKRKGTRRPSGGHVGRRTPSVPSYSSPRSIEGPSRAPSRSPVSAPAPTAAPSRAPSPRQRLKAVRRAYKTGRRTLPGLDPEQTEVASKVLSQGLKEDATKKELQAAAETGLVESDFRNLPGGHADSEGWRQERRSLYPNPRNVKASAKRYFQETEAAGKGRGMTSGQLAQAVQRSAFPERYDERKGEARKIRKAFVKGRAPKPVKPKKAVLSKIPKPFRSEGRGDKRTPAENAAVGGSPTSDHLTTSKGAYAADLPADDDLAKRIAKRLGMRSHTGTNEVTKGGYRYQMIWQDDGHYDHIHLGARKTDTPSSPASTASSGAVSGGYTGASTAPGAATSAGSTVGGASRSRGRSLLSENPRQLLRRLLSERVYGDEEEETERVKPVTRQTVRQKKTKLGLT